MGVKVYWLTFEMNLGNNFRLDIPYNCLECDNIVNRIELNIDTIAIISKVLWKFLPNNIRPLSEIGVLVVDNLL